MRVHSPFMCMVPEKSRRRHSPSEMKLEMFVGHHVDSGKLNPGSLEKQPVLLIEEPSL